MAAAKRAGDGGSGRSHAIDEEARNAGGDQPFVTLMTELLTQRAACDFRVHGSHGYLSSLGSSVISAVYLLHLQSGLARSITHGRKPAGALAPVMFQIV